MWVYYATAAAVTATTDNNNNKKKIKRNSLSSTLFHSTQACVFNMRPSSSIRPKSSVTLYIRLFGYRWHLSVHPSVRPLSCVLRIFYFQYFSSVAAVVVLLFNDNNSFIFLVKYFPFLLSLSLVLAIIIVLLLMIIIIMIMWTMAANVFGGKIQ